MIAVSKDPLIKANFVIKLGPDQIKLKVSLYQWLITAFIYDDPGNPVDLLMNDRLLHLIRLEAKKLGIVRSLKIKIKNIRLDNIFYVNEQIVTF